jgi:GTP cyclohydrolase I
MTTPDRRAAARAIDAFLRAIGRDPASEPHLAGTGERVADAYIDELCEGYGVDVPLLFADAAIAGTCDVVTLRDMTVTTMCPHHLLPAEGTATVAYMPQEKIVALGAIVRLVHAFARRLTLQETIGDEVARALTVHLGAQWAGCRLSLRHACMCARGERQHGARIETVALAGGLTSEERTRAYMVLGAGT